MRKQARLNQTEKLELLEAYKKSGMTQADFAKSWGLNLGTFRSWLYKGPIPEKHERLLDDFTEVRLNDFPDSDLDQIHLKSPRGTEVLLPVSFELKAVLEILSTLDQ